MMCHLCCLLLVQVSMYPPGTLFVHIGYTAQLYQPIQSVEGVLVYQYHEYDVRR